MCKKHLTQSGSSTKSILLELESLRTNTCSPLERMDSSRQSSQDSISAMAFFARDKVDVTVELLNIVEPVNDMIKSGVVCGNVEVVSVNVQFSTKKHGSELCQDHDDGEEFLVTNSVFLLSNIKVMGLEGHRYTILGNISSHLIAGSISIDMKWFIVVRIGQEAVSCHEGFNALKARSILAVQESVFFPDSLERVASMCVH